jgi:uncharacterized surface protein with fasciclin (FAS1) repeats
VGERPAAGIPRTVPVIDIQIADRVCASVLPIRPRIRLGRRVFWRLHQDGAKDGRLSDDGDYCEEPDTMDSISADHLRASSFHFGRVILAAAIAAFLGLGLMSSAKADGVLEVINHDPSYSTFASLLQKTGLAADLKDGGAYTIFAPTNAAFDELTPERREHLFASDSASARRAMESLVVTQRVTPQDLAHNRMLLTSIGGHGVIVDGTEGRLTAEGTEILSVDTSPTNGVIYTIDGVTLDHRHSGRD